ncbi:MAG: hypothetical protein II661_03580 [Bacteroidales bacterium]|nr:hypothetical protein [Bacteroidales bacterium]MBR4176391.1 hypothetical protein [Bacteroidales bacterium]MBR4715633.1 hypothetical protein [Bacteroidales bacterium]
MHRIPVILALALLMVSCNSIVKKKTIDAKSVNFEATYNEDFDNVLYPSMLLALANYRGDDMDTLFTVSVVAPQNNALLRIVVDSTVLNYVSITQEMLPKKGNKYTFAPVIKWKFQSMYRMRQQGIIDLTFTCYINDEEVDVKNIRLNYRPTNECLMSLIGKDGRYHDYRWLFAAYVDEDHPKIDGILSEILSQGIVTTFDGAKNEKKVETQMRAIWYYALNRGLSYSSITCTSNGSKKTNSQYIRFFDDVYVNRQANCIDACVFFSSIMRKVGLLPVIFVDPCHAYLGYYTDKSKKKIALLETTITGWVNLPELDEHYDAESGLLEEKYYAKISKYLNDRQKATYEAGKMTLEDIKKAVANNLFDRAADYQKENYKNNRLLYSDTSQQMYRMLVIDEMRPLISPIPAVEE